MVERVRVLVIGGGAVGCSCLYHLAALGWTDLVLVEQHDLTWDRPACRRELSNLRNGLGRAQAAAVFGLAVSAIGRRS